MNDMIEGNIILLRRDNTDSLRFSTDDGQEFIIRGVTAVQYNVSPSCIPQMTVTLGCPEDVEIIAGIECS